MFHNADAQMRLFVFTQIINVGYLSKLLIFFVFLRIRESANAHIVLRIRRMSTFADPPYSIFQTFCTDCSADSLSFQFSLSTQYKVPH